MPIVLGRRFRDVPQIQSCRCGGRVSSSLSPHLPSLTRSLRDQRSILVSGTLTHTRIRAHTWLLARYRYKSIRGAILQESGSKDDGEFTSFIPHHATKPRRHCLHRVQPLFSLHPTLRWLCLAVLHCMRLMMSISQDTYFISLKGQRRYATSYVSLSLSLSPLLLFICTVMHGSTLLARCKLLPYTSNNTMPVQTYIASSRGSIS